MTTASRKLKEKRGITSFSHSNIDTTHLDRTIIFYGILGLRVGERPDLPAPGAWLYPKGSKHALIHVNAVDKLKGDAGPYDHVAFKVDYTLKQFLKVLEDANVDPGDYRVSEKRPGRRQQVFLKGPMGERVEIEVRP